MFPEKTVIIGGGIVGLTTAVVLKAKAQIHDTEADVIVLEKETLGSGSTLRAGCGLRTVYKHPTNIRLAQAGIQFWNGSNHLLDSAVNFRQNGYLFLTDRDDTDALFSTESERQQLYGLQSSHDAGSNTSYTETQLNRDNYQSVLFAENAGVSSPRQMVDALEMTAESAGVDIQTDTTVTELTDDAETVSITTNSSGTIHANAAVNATGAWARQLAKTVDVTLPIVPQRRRLSVLDQTVSPGEPLTVDVDTGVYFLPDADGVVHAGGHFAQQENTHTLNNSDGFSNRIDPAWNRQFKNKGGRLWDQLAESKITESWTGMYAMTPSRRPIIDRVGNIVHVSGFSGHGIMQAPGAAQIVSTLLGGGTPSLTHTAALAHDRDEIPPDIQF